MATSRRAVALGAAAGLALWCALLEGPGMGNIWWRNKRFSLGGLLAFLIAPVQKPRLLWHPVMWRHNVCIMAGAGGGLGLLLFKLLHRKR